MVPPIGPSIASTSGTAPVEGDDVASAERERIRRAADLLLFCVRPGEPGNDEQARALLAQSLNWADVVRVAHRHGVLARLYRFLASGAPATVPPQLMEQLGRFADAQGARGADLAGEIQRLSARFAECGLRLLFLRCASVLGLFGGDPRWRRPDELDVLVVGEAQKVRQVLAAEGYEPEFDLTDSQAAALAHARGAQAFRHPNGVRLQLHVSHLAPPYLPLNFDPEQLWERRRRAIVGEAGSVDCLSPEDLVVLMCVQGSVHFWDRLVWIEDLAWLAASAGIDWTVVMNRAESARVQRPVLLGLLLASELLGAPISDDAVQRAARDAAVQKLAANVRRRLQLAEPERMTELARASFRLQLQGRVFDRLAYCAAFAFQPDLDDFRAVSVPDSLFFLYHVVRPLRLLSVLAGRALGRRAWAPFVPSPLPVVERMLEVADIRPSDVLFDLGCGDGRIVVEAAARYGVRAVGVDLDPSLIARARANARARGVEHLTSFVQGDAMDVDLADATVVTLWTVPDLNLQLRPRLTRDLKPGARLVSHGFDMGDWAPDRTELVPNDEDFATVYRWTIAGPPAVPGSS